MKSNFSRSYLYVTVFITGAVILVLEILGTRIIAPYYGTTIYVWSSLISVSLLSVSAGYFTGGWLADKKPEAEVLYMLLALAAFAVLAILPMTNPALSKTNALGLRWGAFASAAILFTAPLTLLGMAAPYAIKLKTDRLSGVGASAGSLYGVATLGSVAGAVATGFYVIPSWGISVVIYGCSMLLFVVSLTYRIAFKKKNIKSAVALTLVFTVLAVSVKPIPVEASLDEGFKLVYEKETPYGRLSVLEESGVRRLLKLDGSTQMIYDLRTRSSRIDYLTLLERAVEYHPNPEKVLCVGLGAGMLEKRLIDRNISVVSVEIDPDVVEAARTFFDYSGSAVIDDGRHFIRTTDEIFDVVILDVFLGNHIYPFLFSREAFEDSRGVLADGGILAVNTVGLQYCSLSEDEFVASVYRTLSEVFPHVYMRAWSEGTTNIVFYASETPLPVGGEFIPVSVAGEGIVLSDDYNPIDTMVPEKLHDFWRRTDHSFVDVLH